MSGSDARPDDPLGRAAETPALEPFQVVRVAFPFTDMPRTRRRPALVLSDGDSFNAPVGHAVMAMITSAANPPWPLDVAVGDLEAAGLSVPSKVRCKLFTLDRRLVAGVLGRLSHPDEARVREALAVLLPGAQAQPAAVPPARERARSSARPEAR